MESDCQTQNPLAPAAQSADPTTRECIDVAGQVISAGEVPSQEEKINRIREQAENTLKEIERLEQGIAESQRVIKENRIAQLRQEKDVEGSGVAQPAAAWIVGGDMNLSEGQLVPLCSFFLEPSKPCFSKSGMQRTKDAQKSDIAISQGIALV